MFRATVLGYTYAKSNEELNEIRFYDLQLPTEEAVHHWFRDLCNKDHGYEDFTPCILDKVEEVPNDGKTTA